MENMHQVLEKWAELLLDLGKRNNLVNFHNTKSSSAEVLLPNSEDLFERLQSSEHKLEIYDPKINNEYDESDNDTEILSKEEFLNKYSSKLKKVNQILVYSTNKNPITTIKNIAKRAKTSIEETGVNIAYLVFGFIHWTESENSNEFFSAPILLIPVNIERKSLVEPFFIKIDDDDFIVNSTFNYLLEKQYGVSLPDFEENDTFSTYISKVIKITDKLKWTVSTECKLGIFSFQKINMYRDLKDNINTILQNENIQTIIGGKSFNDNLIDSSNYYVKNPITELHTVVDADSSQIEAIQQAKAGANFVLQGPPGTGKSQTITNIIAECLSDGKRVLFVSEKLAALNVVFDKLSKANLSDFCLELHSHKANKKDVIAELCRTLQLPKTSAASSIEKGKKITQDNIKKLDEYVNELHKTRPIIDLTLYELYNNYSKLRDTELLDFYIDSLKEKDQKYLDEGIILIRQFSEFLDSVGYEYKKNVWYGYINPDISYDATVNLKIHLQSAKSNLEQILKLNKECSTIFGTNFKTISDITSFIKLLDFLQASTAITPFQFSSKNCVQARNNCEKIERTINNINHVKDEIGKDYELDILDVNSQSFSELLKTQYKNAVVRIFSKGYKNIALEIRKCKLTKRKPSYVQLVILLDKINLYKDEKRKFEELDKEISSLLGLEYKGFDTNWNNIYKELDGFLNIFDDSLDLGNLYSIRIEDFEQQKIKFRELVNKYSGSCDLASTELKTILSNFENTDNFLINNNIEDIYKFITVRLEAFDSLDKWCTFREILKKIILMDLQPFVDYVIEKQLSQKDFCNIYEKVFYNQWIQTIIHEVPVLSSFNRINQDQIVDLFKDEDRKQFSANKSLIREFISSQRPNLDFLSEGGNVAGLLREGQKKRKQKNLRTLLHEFRELIQILKPCFLMSPLSVSTYLESIKNYFDVVIFDEASQVFPQDAIGAIFRAKQLIVVGDSKQMPPSNFFSTSIDSDDYDDDEEGVTDFESILDLCSISMRQLRLNWHYRSKNEHLIAFSNKNFYENTLISFPSARQNSEDLGINYYYVDGIYDRKSHTNMQEAEKIISLIHEHYKKYPKLSLGVVAFNVAQQDLIDKLIFAKRQQNSEFDAFFSKETKEPFFVKNLETVQGDERDVILFSMAYGRDTEKRLLLNFGPLNRAGGERRLNVAVTRAKTNIKIVSSMHFSDIDLKRTKSRGTQLLREYLDYAENGEIALRRTTSVSSEDIFDSEFELEVCDFLRKKGYSVDTQIGCSGFKIDLGIKRKDSSDYVLAIECDGATYHSSKNARDRDRLRQDILESMGWKFYRIWSTDWFKNNKEEKQKLLEAVEESFQYVKEDRIQKEVLSESYETTVNNITVKFPTYEEFSITHLKALSRQVNFEKFILKILEKEAPVSEEYLLKRIVFRYNQEKVTKKIESYFNYEFRESFLSSNEVYRKNGFIYLRSKKCSELRVPNESGCLRDIKYISPEELAAGMLFLIEKNISINKDSLFRSIVGYCGFNRTGSSILERLDEAYELIKDNILVENDNISLKKR